MVEDKSEIPLGPRKLAIVGMDSCFGSCEGLEAFGQAIYTGNQAISFRWPGKEGASPSFSQEELLFQVADNALKDLSPDGTASNVAVLVVGGGFGNQAQAAEADRLAKAIGTRWGFSGPCFGVSAKEQAVFRALDVAQWLFTTREIEAVVLGVVDLAEANSRPMKSAGAIVLKRYEQAIAHQNRIYAVIEALSLAQDPMEQGSFVPNAQVVAGVCQQAFNQAGVNPAEIGYVEVCGSGLSDETEAEIEGLNRAYQLQVGRLNSALGSATANFEPASSILELASLIKTTLCLYHRFIPALPDWNGPQKPSLWQGSSFYVADRSRAWFLEDGATRRIAALNGLGREGGYAHLILSEEVNQSAPDRDTDYNLSQAPFYLFPLAAESRAGLLEELETLKQQLQNEVDLPSVARQAFVAFQAQTQATYALAIVGSDRGEVLGEIQAALKGVVIAFDKAGEWKTPLGSYFTAKPLGNIANGSSSVAFVYPGAFNSFVGLGQDLFHLFPRIYDKFVNITPELGMALGEKLLYPRSLEKLSKEQLENLEAQLGLDQVTMIESGASFAVLFTMIMRHYFQVQPRASFGYSMGETSMLWAMEVWTGGGLGLATFHESPLFRTRLTGPKETVRELWGLEQANDDFWTNYFLLAPVAKVREALKNEERVYLTHINTAQEVIIGGAKEGCLRVIEKLKCHYLHRPVSFVLHCEPVRAEYEELVKLHTFPCRDMPEVAFYTAADYQPLPFDSTSLGQKIAQMICQPLDFPRLVNQVYDDGAKIFVELGPGNTCSRWIGKILRHKDHATLSISQKGVDDHISIVKVLARLLSHRVPLNLAPLYGHVQERSNIDLATPPLYPDEQFQKLSENSELATKAHATFLQVRQEASRQMSELLRLQTQLVESLLELSNTDEHREPQRTTDNFIDNTHTTWDAAPSVDLPSWDAAPSVDLPSVDALFNEEQLKEFATGSIVKCFGSEYHVYDGRRVPRIPNGDLMLMSRILELQGTPHDFKNTASIVAEYDVPEDAWFYTKNAYPYLPYSMYMENALQPCGFLAAYLGSCLIYRDIDLYFRNLDGQGTILRDIDLRGKTITNRAKLLATSVFEGTVIQRFEFEALHAGLPFYKGEAVFGYFSREVMANQIGLDGGKDIRPWFEQKNINGLPAVKIDLHSAAAKEQFYQLDPEKPYYRLAGGQLDFLDEVLIIPGGGKHGQGYIYASKVINPADWFYTCHFHQDAVMPGSLGLEAIVQAMQTYALQQDLGSNLRSPRFGQLSKQLMPWKYRGQIIPANKKMYLEIHLTGIKKIDGKLTLLGDASLWKDNIRIYEFKQVGLCLFEA